MIPRLVAVLGFVVLIAAASTERSDALPLIVNGDFSAGNTGFTSAYSFTPGTNTAAEQYNVLSDASTWNTFFAGVDHTTGDGLFMAVNGSADPDLVVWSQTVGVLPNETYQMSFWYSKIDIFVNGIAQLELSINGVPVGSVVSVTCQNWTEFTTSWNAGSSTSAVLEIRDLSTASSGNDFGLDDISMIPEPSTALLLAMGFVALTTGVRRPN